MRTGDDILCVHIGDINKLGGCLEIRSNRRSGMAVSFDENYLLFDFSDFEKEVMTTLLTIPCLRWSV